MSLEEKLDPSSAAGELVFHVFGAVSSRNICECELIVQK
jgi:hypothetical protein